MLEVKIEQKLREKVKKLGGRAYKFVSPGQAGVPDRLIVLPGGKVGFAELKKPGGRPRKLQKMQIKFLQNLGCKVMVIDSEEQINKFINKILGGDNHVIVKSKESIESIKRTS